ncbi:unnamed protein product, partial [Brenthis ino]
MNNENNNEENDVSNADVIIFKNNTASGASLSEVGSLATSAQQQPDATTEPDHRLNTTSNTGTVLPQDQPQSALLNASMNSIPPQFLMQIMQVMQQMSERLSTPPETKIRINDIYLPSFEPDTNVGVQNMFMTLQKTSRFLSRAWVLWRRITKDKLSNEDAVEAVIGCVNDERLRIELLNTRATTVKIGPRTFQAVFDSGAECSLIRESIAAQLPGKRLETVNYLMGIGQFPVLSIATLVTIGVIDNINVEPQFYIVADYEMTTDILIGMNLINNTNLTMMITSVGTRLTRLLNINQVQCMNPIFDKLDCDLTSEEDITKLRTLLNKYQHLFIRVQIVVDGGREFLGEFKTYCDRVGIDVHAIAPGVSRANGQVERVVATLKNTLVMIKNYETEEWHTTLEELQLALNCTSHRVTGVAPLTLLTQRRHCVPPELLTLVNIDEQTIDIEALTSHVQQKMSQNAEQDKQRFNSKKAKIRQFQRGDYVLIKNNPRNQTSLDLKFSEPYEILKILNNDRYLVKKVVGSGRPRKVAHDQLRRAPQPGDQMTVSAEEVDSPASTNEAIASTSRSNIVEQRTQE